MLRSFHPVLMLTAVAVWPNCAGAQTSPALYTSEPCRVAPLINGVEDAKEWAGATRIEVVLPMLSGKGQTRSERKGELLLMNSASNLYVALRIPDAALNMSLSPLDTDMAALVFCQGNELADGDDRRIVLPGISADKHFVAPGRDADDAQQNGKATMGWKKTGQGGEYFVEWHIPLDGSDKNDISGKPGDRFRFNIVYADRFSGGLTDTEIGGLFGADLDHATGWGSLQLAENVGAEAPAPAPAWAGTIFPNTTKPGRSKNRLRRIDVAEKEVNGRLTGSATVELTYPGLGGNDEVGQARIFLPPEIVSGTKKTAPYIHIAGYEIDENGGAALAAKGYIVSTPHASALNPLSRGANLDNAILHAVRQLPCVDLLRVTIQGGSAGGWMTLMLAADSFPVLCALPDVPPIHWGYNGAYIDEHRAMAALPGENAQPKMPVLLAVADIASTSKTHYGMPWESAALLGVSPLAQLDTITAPTLAIFSTADMLVPIDQVSSALVEPLDASLFPPGFSTAMTDRFPGVQGTRTLLENLKPTRYQLFQLPADPKPVGFVDGVTPIAGKLLNLPFSKTKVWSIVIIDEGAVEPGHGHFKYNWVPDHEPFRKWAESQGVTAAQLTLPKLERLMKRWRGEAWRPIMVRPGGTGRERPGNQLDYPEAERADVLRGLQAFARDDKRALHLAKLYSQLPSALQVFGPRLGSGTPQSIRNLLQTADRTVSSR